MNRDMTYPLMFCSNAFASVLATTMSPEMQTWEALKDESFLLCKVVQQIEELNEKHMCEYDALRQEQYQRLVKVGKPFPIN